MKFFIGAKNLNGQVIVAEIVDVETFGDAYQKAHAEAEKAVGRFNYRLTAVNEQIDMPAARTGVRDQVAQFLEGSPA